jgi:hypothetical protein
LKEEEERKEEDIEQRKLQSSKGGEVGSIEKIIINNIQKKNVEKYDSTNLDIGGSGNLSKKNNKTPIVMLFQDD